MPAQYHFRTDWAFQGRLGAVWNAVLDIEHYPAWWSNFRRVKLLRGDGKAPGSVIECEVRGSLPYSLSYALEVIGAEPMRSIDLRSSGDLVGTGRWEFIERAPKDTLATYFWDVGTTNPLLNLVAPLARGLLAKNHEQVMANGYAALRKYAERAG